MRAAVLALLVLGACSKREAPVETVTPIVEPHPVPLVSAAPSVTVAPSSTLTMPMEITANADAGRSRSGGMSAQKQAELQKQLELMNVEMLKTLNSKGSSTDNVLSNSDVNMKLLDDAYTGRDGGPSVGGLSMGSGGGKIVSGGGGLAGIGDTRDH